MRQIQTGSDPNQHENVDKFVDYHLQNAGVLAHGHLETVVAEVQRLQKIMGRLLVFLVENRSLDAQRLSHIVRGYANGEEKFVDEPIHGIGPQPDSTKEIDRETSFKQLVKAYLKGIAEYHECVERAKELGYTWEQWDAAVTKAAAMKGLTLMKPKVENYWGVRFAGRRYPHIIFGTAEDAVTSIKSECKEKGYGWEFIEGESEFQKLYVIANPKANKKQAIFVEVVAVYNGIEPIGIVFKEDDTAIEGQQQ